MGILWRAKVDEHGRVYGRVMKRGLLLISLAHWALLCTSDALRDNQVETELPGLDLLLMNVSKCPIMTSALLLMRFSRSPEVYLLKLVLVVYVAVS